MKQLTTILATLTVVILAALIGFLVIGGSKDPTEKADPAAVQLPKDSLQLAMHIIYYIKPERIADFKKAFDKCAVETHKEPGCGAYALYQSYNDTTEFFLFEKWSNRAAHKAHTATEHLKVYFNEINGVFDDARQAKVEVVQVAP